MSDLNQDVSRRELLRNIGISLTLTGFGANAVSAEAAQHVHQAVSQEKAAAKGAYVPKCFTKSEYATLRRLAELIIPADERSKGALEAGAPEFIDLLAGNNGELAAIYTGGLAWLNEQMKDRNGADFVNASPQQQTAMLDLIAFEEKSSPELAPGTSFFRWVRNMTVDAFYTSKIGMDDLGFKGNGAMSQFSVPDEALNYALKRCPV